MLGVGVVDFDIHAGSGDRSILGELGEARGIQGVVGVEHQGCTAGGLSDDHASRSRVIQHQQRTRPSLLRFTGDGTGSHAGGVAIQRPCHVGGLEVPGVVVDVHCTDALDGGIQATTGGGVVLLLDFLRLRLIGEAVAVADLDQTLRVFQVLEVDLAYPQECAAQISHCWIPPAGCRLRPGLPARPCVRR
ncbi:hypothetical protein D3C85_1345540 [compost metagenome]